MIDNLQLNDLLGEIGNFMLRWIFERKTFALVDMFLIISSELQGAKVALKKCTFVIPDNICFCSMIRNFEGKNIVTL